MRGREQPGWGGSESALSPGLQLAGWLGCYCVASTSVRLTLGRCACQSHLRPDMLVSSSSQELASEGHTTEEEGESIQAATAWILSCRLRPARFAGRGARRHRLNSAPERAKGDGRSSMSTCAWIAGVSVDVAEEILRAPRILSGLSRSSLAGSLLLYVSFFALPSIMSRRLPDVLESFPGFADAYSKFVHVPWSCHRAIEHELFPQIVQEHQACQRNRDREKAMTFFEDRVKAVIQSMEDATEDAKRADQEDSINQFGVLRKGVIVR